MEATGYVHVHIRSYIGYLFWMDDLYVLIFSCIQVHDSLAAVNK
jgi:hypothetical protein